MKATNIITRLVMGCVLALGITNQTLAIEGLKLQIRCPHVVLSWPSTNGETYIVQYRATLDTNSTWQTLTNFMPPATGTNTTYFVHSNRVDCPAGQVFGMMRLASGDGAETTELKSVTASLSNVERAELFQARETVRLAALFEKCKVEGREPFEWELKNFPPLPPTVDEVRAKILRAKERKFAAPDSFQAKSSYLVAEAAVALESFGDASFAGGAQSANGPSSSTGSEPSCGFYRVVRNGIHMFGITNGMVVSGVMNIPIEYSMSSTDELTGFSFFAGSNPLSGVDFENEDMVRMLRWNTQTMTNGVYQISAAAGFVVDAAVTNQPVTVTVSNLVSFPNNFSAIFGDWMWVNVKVGVPVASLEIKIHDENDNYLGSFFESTTNGTISFIWDLTDGGGYTFPDSSFRGEFYVSTPASGGGGGGMSSVPGGMQTWSKEAYWAYNDKFVVAFGAADNNNTTTLKIQSMVIGGINGGEYGGVVSTLSLNGGGGYALSPGNVYGSSAFQLYDASTRTQLLGYLADPQYRNFYYFGHGHKRGIAGITRPSLILDQDIVHTLHNYINSAKPTNGHPYRLVFIDGCDTGNGNFCEGFGIPAKVTNRAFFQGAGVQTRAFLGFTGDVPFNPAQWIERSLQLSSFFTDWNNFKPLSVCISNVVNGTYSQLQTLPSSWIIYGATDLRKDLY